MKPNTCTYRTMNGILSTYLCCYPELYAMFRNKCKNSTKSYKIYIISWTLKDFCGSLCYSLAPKEKGRSILTQIQKEDLKLIHITHLFFI